MRPNPTLGEGGRELRSVGARHGPVGAGANLLAVYVRLERVVGSDMEVPGRAAAGAAAAADSHDLQAYRLVGLGASRRQLTAIGQ